MMQRRSSASSSFVLATLRALQLDTSHATLPTAAARNHEKTSHSPTTTTSSPGHEALRT